MALAVVVPWLAPLTFGSHPPGWRTGASGTLYRRVGRAHARVPVSTAWAANVRYRDRAVDDPPNRSLKQLPARGVIVWAQIHPLGFWSPAGRRVSSTLTLARAYRFACCEPAPIGGEWEIYARGPRAAYGVLVRVYWGSPPTRAMRAAAEAMLRRLRLPPPRR